MQMMAQHCDGAEGIVDQRHAEVMCYRQTPGWNGQCLCTSGSVYIGGVGC